MLKMRIRPIPSTALNGGTHYIVQVRFLLIWWNLGYDFGSRKVAEDFVRTTLGRSITAG